MYLRRFDVDWIGVQNFLLVRDLEEKLTPRSCGGSRLSRHVCNVESDIEWTREGRNLVGSTRIRATTILLGELNAGHSGLERPKSGFHWKGQSEIRHDFYNGTTKYSD